MERRGRKEGIRRKLEEDEEALQGHSSSLPHPGKCNSVSSKNVYVRYCLLDLQLSKIRSLKQKKAHLMEIQVNGGTIPQKVVKIAIRLP